MTVDVGDGFHNHEGDGGDGISDDEYDNDDDDYYYYDDDDIANLMSDGSHSNKCNNIVFTLMGHVKNNIFKKNNKNKNNNNKLLHSHNCLLLHFYFYFCMFHYDVINIGVGFFSFKKSARKDIWDAYSSCL